MSNATNGSHILHCPTAHSVIHVHGLDSTFKCSLSTTNNRSQSVSTTIQCDNLIASQQNLYLKIVSTLNIVFLSLITLEMLPLCQRFPIFQELKYKYNKCMSKFIKALFCVMIGLLFILFIIPDIIQK